MSQHYEYDTPAADETALGDGFVEGTEWDVLTPGPTDMAGETDSAPTSKAEQLLELSDWDRRGLARDAFQGHLEANGHEGGVVYLPNVNDALPGTAGAALEAHGVPPAAYGGRMYGIALSMRPDWPVRVVTEHPLQAEKDMVASLAERMGCSAPQPIGSVQEAPSDSYVLPFISSEGTTAVYAERTLPDATPFNNKAVMRGLLREIGKEDSLVPGAEVMHYPNETAEELFARVADAAREQAVDGNIWIKHAGTSSGLNTARYKSGFFNEPNHQQQLEADLREMFRDPETGEPELDDVVIERNIDFGQSATGYGDYGLRGVMTHGGDFIPFSVGRQLSNADGEYIGMSIAQLDRDDQLEAIGMDPATLRQAIRTTEALVQRAHDFGYVGPVNVDFFSQQNNPESEILMRDFNLREGGSSFASTISGMDGEAWPGATGVMDTELKVHAGALLDDAELETMVGKMYGSGIMPYATTFLRYPKTQADGSIMYTIKVVAPRYDSVSTDAEAVAQVQSIAEHLNQDTVPNVRFASPIAA